MSHCDFEEGGEDTRKEMQAASRRLERQEERFSPGFQKECGLPIP